MTLLQTTCQMCHISHVIFSSPPTWDCKPHVTYLTYVHSVCLMAVRGATLHGCWWYILPRVCFVYSPYKEVSNLSLIFYGLVKHQNDDVFSCDTGRWQYDMTSGETVAYGLCLLAEVWQLCSLLFRHLRWNDLETLSHCLSWQGTNTWWIILVGGVAKVHTSIYMALLFTLQSIEHISNIYICTNIKPSHMLEKIVFGYCVTRQLWYIKSLSPTLIQIRFIYKIHIISLGFYKHITTNMNSWKKP